MLRGPSGGGKTSLLNILGTIDMPSGGTIGLYGCVYVCVWASVCTTLRYVCSSQKVIVHICFSVSELLGTVVDSSSSDDCLARLRLEKIGMDGGYTL
jgi:ABC-type multidrug transport system ATPase subunit